MTNTEKGNDIISYAKIDDPVEGNFISVPYVVLQIDKGVAWEEIWAQIEHTFRNDAKVQLMIAPVNTVVDIVKLLGVGFHAYPFVTYPAMCLTRFRYNEIFLPIFLKDKEKRESKTN
jgi:hypothetical protein